MLMTKLEAEKCYHDNPVIACHASFELLVVGALSLRQ